jgi:hypothetical protein
MSTSVSVKKEAPKLTKKDLNKIARVLKVKKSKK